MQNAMSDWITAQTSACFAVTWPEGIGRDAVRATLPSKSRSVMSFHVQPAPRIRKAPMPQPRMIQASKRLACPVENMASSVPQTHGRYSSHVPMGRSARLSRR